MGLLSEYHTVNRLLKQKQQVVFYAESRHYLQYFMPLLVELLKKEVQVCYITSDPSDKLLQKPQNGLNVFFVKWMLGVLFSRLKADVMIMTMPDLDHFLYKRSPDVGTYIYMFHAAVSTHQQYRKDAFTNYDCIFCTGEYQHAEIRMAEQLYGYESKALIPYGYPLFDKLQKAKSNPVSVTKPVILVAPSWFSGCIFETCIEELLKELTVLPYQIILRSHPEYEKRNKKSFNRIKKLVSAYPDMSIDDLPDVADRLSTTDILITDRSGIALEFAIGAGKPVVFIETALKEANKQWRELEITPLENDIRSALGITLEPSSLNTLADKLEKAELLKEGFSEKMKLLKEKYFYNSTDGCRQGLSFILGKISEKQQ